MTLIHAIPSRTGNVRRPITRPRPGPRWDGDGLAGSRRPAPSRPVGAPARYRGSGVAMSVAPHWRRAALWLVILAVVAPCSSNVARRTGSSGRKPKSTPRRGAPGLPRLPATSKRTFMLGIRSLQARGMSTEFFEKRVFPSYERSQSTMACFGTLRDCVRICSCAASG